MPEPTERRARTLALDGDHRGDGRARSRAGRARRRRGHGPAGGDRDPFHRARAVARRHPLLALRDRDRRAHRCAAALRGDVVEGRGRWPAPGRRQGRGPVVRSPPRAYAGPAAGARPRDPRARRSLHRCGGRRRHHRRHGRHRGRDAVGHRGERVDGWVRRSLTGDRGRRARRDAGGGAGTLGRRESHRSPRRRAGRGQGRRRAGPPARRRRRARLDRRRRRCARARVGLGAGRGTGPRRRRALPAGRRRGAVRARWCAHRDGGRRAGVHRGLRRRQQPARHRRGRRRAGRPGDPLRARLRRQRRRDPQHRPGVRGLLTRARPRGGAWDRDDHDPPLRIGPELGRGAGAGCRPHRTRADRARALRGRSVGAGRPHRVDRRATVAVAPSALRRAPRPRSRRRGAGP